MKISHIAGGQDTAQGEITLGHASGGTATPSTTGTTPPHAQGNTPSHSAGAAEDPEVAEAMELYHALGPTPPHIDVASNDAANATAHTLERHGSSLPLERDPSPNSGNRTVEGRIYGDPPWPRPENWSYRWSSDEVMHRTINRYVRDNWETIRSDLATGPLHEAVFDAGRVVGEGYFNSGMYGAGPQHANYGMTPLVNITLRRVDGSPPSFFVVTAYPRGRWPHSD